VQCVDFLVPCFSFFSVPVQVWGVTNEGDDFAGRMNKSLNVEYVFVDRFDKVAFTRFHDSPMAVQTKITYPLKYALPNNAVDIKDYQSDDYERRRAL
jgi:hypothetical protein